MTGDRFTHLTIDGRPKAKARPRFGGGGRVYADSATVAAEDNIKWHAGPLFKSPVSGPVSLTVSFEMPVPLCWSKDGRDQQRELALVGAFPHVTVPDVDNLVKLVQDALNGVAYVDDSQIVQLAASKFYGSNPCTRIIIERLQ